MNQNELNAILEKHKLWLKNEEGGEQANLQGADLQGADLQRANLQGADLQGTDLQGTDLQRANLQRANLQGADLQGADLRWADLRRADLRRADLQGTDLDYSCLPLWCGSKDMKVDRRIYLQLLAHLCALDVNDDECKAHQAASMDLATQSHRAEELLGD